MQHRDLMTLSRLARALLLTTSVVSCKSVRDPLSARFSGCPGVEAGPTCVTPDEELLDLSIWVDTKNPVTVHLDGRSITATTTPVGGGQRLQLSARGPGRLMLDAGRARFTLTLSAKSRATEEAIRISAEGHKLQGGTEWRRALDMLEQSATKHARAGAWSRAVRDVQTGAYALLYQGHRLEEAERWLARADPWLEHYAEGWAFQPYYRALLALAAADPARALSLLDTSARRLRSFAPALVDVIEDTRAHALQLLGRHAEVQRIHERLSASAVNATCERARRLNMLAWSALLHADSIGGPTPPRARAWLDEARGIFEGKDCPKWHHGSLVPMHLAFAEILDGRHEAAQTWLALAPADSAVLADRLWRLELEGRIAAARGRWRDALSAADRLQRIATEALEMDAVWRAEILRANSYALGGDGRREIAALERAEDLLSDVMLSVPLGEGRAAFLAERGKSAQALARRAIDRGALDRAACVLRRARARGLSRAARALALHHLPESAKNEWAQHLGAVRAIHAEIQDVALSAWDLPADEHALIMSDQDKRIANVRRALGSAIAKLEAVGEAPDCDRLRAPEVDEVVLGYFTVDGGAVGLALTATTTRMHAFDPAPATPSAWLAPFAPEIDSARQVRILTGGPTAEVRLHAAPWGDRSLGASRAVSYSLDLPIRPPSASVTDHALVVSDAGRNLRGARKEGERVAQSLREHGWSVVRASGKDATPQKVRSALETASLFHFAGHARVDDRSRWSDRLVLHGGDLEARDILAAAAVPRWVVLTGCETSAIRPDAEGGELSLAHAFVLAGAEQVVAATEPLPDGATELVGDLLHTNSKPGAVDLAEALRLALSKTPEGSRAHIRSLGVWTR